MHKLWLGKICLILFLLFALNGVRGQSVLYPGDIALLTLNSDGLKNFDFVALVDLTAGTTIHFTDDAWIGGETNSFQGSEGILTYIAPDNISAGSLVSCPSKDGGNGFTESGSFNPSASGDNIIIYQGTQQNPVFIYGAGWARGSTVWEYSTVSSFYRSDIPPGLSTDNYTITSLGTSDNYQYNDTNGTSGKAVTILKLLSDANNYISDNSTAYQELSLQFNMETALTVCTGDNISWENAIWSNGLPNETMDVIIDGIIYIDENFTCHDFTINEGKIVEIFPGVLLNVKRRITNNAGNEGLIIQSDANNSGNFISGENVSGTYKLYIEKDQWHFVSSPVNQNLSINDLFGTAEGDLFGIYCYDEESNLWTSSSGSSMIKQKGYNVYYENQSKTISFSGELSSYQSYQNIPLTRTENNGWNLIGNPFPSSLDWGVDENADSKGWYRQNELVENKTIYITTGGSDTNTSFSVYNGNSGIGIPDNNARYISAGQGFWVRALSAGNLGLSNNARTSKQSNFKSFSPIRSTIRIEIIAGNFKDQTVVCYLNNAVEDYGIYDSEKLINRNNNLVEIFSIIPGKDLAINALPEDRKASEIQLGYYSSIRGNTEIKINVINNESNSIKVSLEDKYENITKETSDETNYPFFSDEGEFTDRFILKVSHLDLTKPEIKENSIEAEIILIDNLLHINVLGLFSKAKYYIYNTNGQLLQSGYLHSQGLNQYSVNCRTGVYVVCLIVDGKRFIRKIIST